MIRLSILGSLWVQRRHLRNGIPFWSQGYITERSKELLVPQCRESLSGKRNDREWQL